MPPARMPNRPDGQLGNTFQSQVETYDPRFGKDLCRCNTIIHKWCQDSNKRLKTKYEGQEIQTISGFGAQIPERGGSARLPSAIQAKIDKSSKIAISSYDEKYSDLPLGYREESTRVGPWQHRATLHRCKRQSSIYSRRWWIKCSHAVEKRFNNTN